MVSTQIPPERDIDLYVPFEQLVNVRVPGRPAACPPGPSVCVAKGSVQEERHDSDMTRGRRALVAVDLLAAGAASACVGKSQPLMVLESMSVKPSLETGGSLPGR